MIILVDMDNTLVDFDKAFLESWKDKYPGEYFVPLEERKNFHPHKDYPETLQKKVLDICHGAGFIRNLSPMPGGIEAVTEMLRDGHDVRFCTSYLFEYKNSVLEKYEWVEQYFGFDAIERIIMTRDKTLITGDILIDDKPEIIGIKPSSWEHILYDRPHNQHIKNRRRLTWDNWREIVYNQVK